jgi:hypothetical protein
MKPAQFQGQEDPRLARIDDLLQLPLLTLRTMQHSRNPRSYRPKLRQQLQDAVDECMRLADALDN